MTIKIIALIGALSCSSFADDFIPSKAIEMFKDFEAGKFMQPPSPVRMGWMMEGPEGKMLSRTVLNHQAEQVAMLGVEAFPTVLKQLEHKDMYIRYIAATALRMISGEDPVWYTFGIPGEKFNGNSDWSKDAKETWRSWYEKHRKKLRFKSEVQQSDVD